MKIRNWLFLTIIATFFAAAANADCTPPGAAPSQFPDGSKASQDEMLAAKKQVDTYVSNARDYVSCIDSNEAAALKEIRANDKISKDDKDSRIKALEEKRKARNKVVEQMHTAAKAFNAEIEKYNQR